MSISKTRQKLVDVARQLFAKNGLENTTMNDIAQQSGKGRRTLYTYFKSKDEVYFAVIESELERLSDKMDEVAAKRTSPQDKILELIYTHLDSIKETVMRNGNLRAAFFRNIWMVEKVRKNFDEAEIELFRKVYADGKAEGEFDIDNVELVADITHYCIKGLEVPYIYGRLGHGMTPERSKPLVAKFVYGALCRSSDINKKSLDDFGKLEGMDGFENTEKNNF
jgi:AcrR family transcriptional regulator